MNNHPEKNFVKPLCQGGALWSCGDICVHLQLSNAWFKIKPRAVLSVLDSSASKAWIKRFTSVITTCGVWGAGKSLTAFASTVAATGSPSAESLPSTSSVAQTNCCWDWSKCTSTHCCLLRWEQCNVKKNATTDQCGKMFSCSARRSYWKSRWQFPVGIQLHPWILEITASGADTQS